MTNMDMIRKISEVLDKNCDEPSEEMIKMGKCLQQIGGILKGKSLSDARSIMEAVKAMTQIKSKEDNDKEA
jgi:hypothetical protein